jgi:hypothetical protein
MIIENVDCDELESKVTRTAYIAILEFIRGNWRKPQCPIERLAEQEGSKLREHSNSILSFNITSQFRLCDALCKVWEGSVNYKAKWEKGP